MYKYNRIYPSDSQIPIEIIATTACKCHLGGVRVLGAAVLRLKKRKLQDKL